MKPDQEIRNSKTAIPSTEPRLTLVNAKPRQSESGRRRRTPPARIIESVLRWGIAVGVIFLVSGSLTSLQDQQGSLDQLNSRLAEEQLELGDLQDQADSFSDPQWRESYWKWRTMRHEPGEHYIDFVDPETL